MNYDGPAIADALARARHRIERDEALLRRALTYILNDGDFLNPNAIESTRQLIAALRERLKSTKGEN